MCCFSGYVQTAYILTKKHNNLGFQIGIQIVSNTQMIFRPADGGDEEDEENVIQWPCSACTYLNHPLLKDCEQVIVLDSNFRSKNQGN